MNGPEEVKNVERKEWRESNGEEGCRESSLEEQRRLKGRRVSNHNNIGQE